MSRALCALLLGAVWIAALALGCGADELSDSRLESYTPTYSVDVRPILTRHCTSCHDRAGKRLGGVELDQFVSAHAQAVRIACTSASQSLVDRYPDQLKPEPRNPPVSQATCGDWEVYSMPPDAQPRLAPAEQHILVRWAVTGAKP
jgi:hypothetical protein